MLAILVCPLRKELLVNAIGGLEQNFSHFLSNLKVNNDILRRWPN
jgi:hypothetical protein